MKRILLWIATMLQILLLVTAYGIHVFSTKKMGLMRHLVYLNNKWEESYPAQELQFSAIVIFSVLAIIALTTFMKKKKDGSPLGKLPLLMIVSLTILTVTFIIVTLAFSVESFRSFYIVTLLLGVATLIQNINVFVYLKWGPKRKSV